MSSEMSFCGTDWVLSSDISFSGVDWVLSSDISFSGSRTAFNGGPLINLLRFLLAVDFRCS